MKYPKVFFVSLFLMLPFIIVSSSFSEVEILLKNGGSIIADSCTEANGKLVCSKMGGTFDIEKNDVSETKEITVDTQTQSSEAETEAKQEKTKKPATGAGDSAKPDAGVLIKGTTPEAEKRLDQISKRKTDLKTDRDNLIKEREQLHEDVRNMKVIRSQEEFDAIKKRIADLETRINTFNVDVKKLDEEEQKLLNPLQNRQ